MFHNFADLEFGFFLYHHSTIIRNFYTLVHTPVKLNLTLTQRGLGQYA